MRTTGLLAGLCGLTVVLAGVGCSSPNTAPPSSGPATPAGSAGPAFNVVAADLPPLPMSLAGAVRPVSVVKSAYEFAARHPEVLRYVPCFCGCERGGHTANHDCYVRRRDREGHVTEWDDHAIGCEICVDVAQMAMQMYNSGASVPAIRDAVEQRFASDGMGHTPTPMPPASGLAGGH
jgi:Protein of unknown function with PCYCGC motif